MDRFYKADQLLWRAKGFYSPKTGELIQFKDSDKILMVYMQARIDFFIREKNQPLFECQQTIADQCGLEYRTVHRITQDLVEHGVLVAGKQKPPKGRERWYYSAIVMPKLWQGDKKNPEPLTWESITQKKEDRSFYTPSKPLKPKTVPLRVIEDEDDFDLPF